MASPGGYLVRLTKALCWLRLCSERGADNQSRNFYQPRKGTRGQGWPRLIFDSDTLGRAVLSNRLGVQPAYLDSISYSLSFSVGNVAESMVDSCDCFLVIDGCARRPDLHPVCRSPDASSERLG